FVKLESGASMAEVEARMSAVVKKYNPASWKSSREELFLHPMSDWHLYSDFKDGRAEGGFIEYVRLFSIIGVLVLLIACVNFMNLSTARSEKRAREVGVRKVVGSLRRDLIIQFLVESTVITLVAAVIALALVEAALPPFNALTQCAVSIPWGSGLFWAAMAGYVLGTALLAGARPAFYLSSFRPVKVLKGVGIGRAASWPRKILVVLQFTCSVALVISTLLIYRQIQYAKDRPNGYDANRLVYTDGSDDLDRNYPALSDELMRTGLVARVTRASTFVNNLLNWSNIENWSGRYPDESLAMATVDVVENYFSTVGIPMVSGKNFSGNPGADTLSVVLNEAAVRRMRFKDPLGQVITFRKGRRIKVIGVVKDALMLSPFSPPEPTFFTYSPGDAGNIIYRLSPSVEVHDAMARLGPIFNKYNPSYPFIYHFADTSYAEKFQFEELIGRLAGIFAALAIFISCLGLFGLAAYMAEQRTREIGIRKVLGASLGQLWYLLSKDFVILVLVSCVVASPLAWYFLQGWLQKYQYRIGIGVDVFLEAGVMALLIALVTVGWQAVRGALANPAKSLKAE
ncbi:MAG: ABC transporter permease, partial [Bacteroidetes bacterium]|nr:ABC transporter permease [Bacteroidota bacterium]